VIGIFKQKAPGNIALLFIFGLLIKLPLFFAPQMAVATPLDGKFYQILITSFKKLHPVGASIIAFACLYIQSLQLTYMVNEYRMTTKPSFLPGMAYLLITSLIPDWSFLSATLIANTFIIWGFIKLFDLYNAPAANGRIFNIGLLVGLASFFFFPSLFVTICVLIGLLIMRPFRLNEIVLMILGVATPFYFFAVYLFLNDRFALNQLFPNVNIMVPELRESIWQVIATVLIGAPFLAGGYYIQTHLRKMLIQARKTWSVILIFLFLALFIPFTNSTQTYATWVLAAAPFAIFHAAAYFYPARRKWIPVVLFFLTLAFILTQQYIVKTWHI
jgi:hypothetical protein